MDASRFATIARTSSPASTGTVSTRPSSAEGSAFSKRLASAVPDSEPTGADILRELLSSASPVGHSAPPMRSELMGLLMLQYNLSRGRTTLVSNILRVRHDTAKNSISNLR